LDLKVVEYFDFFPSDSGFLGMKDREEFPRGPNEDYLRSLFYIIQATGNEALAPGIRRRLEQSPTSNREVVIGLVEDLERGRLIEGRLSPGHYGVPYANFRAEAIERALAACGGGAAPVTDVSS